MFKHWLANLEKRIIDISGKNHRPRLFSFEHLLVVVSRLYGLGVRLRLTMYKIGILKQKRLPCFVVSIGNIMAGGSGKTPMAIHLAEALIGMGYNPVVLSRGYKGALGKSAGIVGDGNQVFLDADTAGDEPFMMAQQKRFPVVVGKDRYEAGRLALDQFDVDVIILDDGFQHMRLARDMNLVLFDHDAPLGNTRMLPAGRLRETPAMARDRIHGILLTRCPESDLSGDGRALMPDVIGNTFKKIPFFKTLHQPYLSGFRPKDLIADLPEDFEFLKNRSAILFSGIARNDSFRETVSRFGVKVLDHLEFQDHYRYKRSDFADIRDHAAAIGADIILTTEKDWVKVDRSFTWERDVAVIGIRIGFDNPEAFDSFVKSRLNM